jgi:membrane protein DedA with SNARE-associated domain
MTQLIHHYGAWVVFILVFLETIGLPLPGETILISAAIYAGTTQDLSIGLVLLAAVLGAMLGSAVGYAVGNSYGYPLLLRFGSYIGLTEPRIKIAQYLFKRRGVAVVVVARFVAGLRSIAAFIAGAGQMPIASFMIANVASAVGWALAYGLAAYYLGREVEQFAKPAAIALAVAGAIVIIAGIVYWRRKEQELAAAAERAIPGPLHVAHPRKSQ